VPRYPSDLSDAQWAVLRPEAERVMADLRRAAGRPMVHDLRAMVDAIGYVVRNGIEWRALPVDFPPWEAVDRVLPALEPARPTAPAGRPAAEPAAGGAGP
jgi:transposase